MSRYGRLLKNIGAFTVSNIALKLITFLLVPFYTYYLSTTEFGITDMLNTVVALIQPLVTGSIADAVLRYAIDKKADADRYISFGFLITVFSCALVAVLLPILNLSVFGGLGQYKLWFLLAYATMTIHNFLSYAARALDRVSVMMYASIASSAVNIVSSVITIAVLHMGVRGFFLSLVVGNFVGCLWYLCIGGLYRNCIWRGRFGRDLFKLFLYSLPLVPNALFWWISQSINRFFITGLMGIAASGLFAAASRIPGILNLVVSIFQQAWNLSAFQEYKAKGRDVFFTAIFKLYSFCLTACAGVLICSSKWLAALLFQKGFFQAWSLVPILMVAFYFSGLNTFYGSVYTASMKTRYLFATTVVGALVCLGGTWILIRLVGLPGAGIATALGNATVWLMRVLDSRRFIHIRTSIWVQLGTVVLLLTATVLITVDTTGSIVGAYLAVIALLVLQAYHARKELGTICFKVLAHAKS